MTDEKLFRFVGAGENTPTHIPCRVFVADLRRVFEAGRQAEAASRDAEVVSLTNQRDYEYVRAENAEHDKLLADATRYRWLRKYMASSRTDLDDALVEACSSDNPDELDVMIDLYEAIERCGVL